MGSGHRHDKLVLRLKTTGELLAAELAAGRVVPLNGQKVGSSGQDHWTVLEYSLKRIGLPTLLAETTKDRDHDSCAMASATVRPSSWRV